MRRLHAILSLVLALAVVAGAAVHDARAAGMAAPIAMEWSAGAAEPCDLCGRMGDDAAVQCALACAALAGVMVQTALLHDRPADRPRPGTPASSAGRFAGPEPDPPR